MLGYTDEYIEKVLSKAYCCIGDSGTQINNKMRTGLPYKPILIKQKSIFLYALALRNRSYLSQDQINAIVEKIIASCGCGVDDTVIIQETSINHYWDSAYSDNSYTQ